MTHLNRGNYAKKHPDATISSEAETLLKAEAENGKISCAAVHKVAKKLGITPADTGIQVDLLELRLIRCSLGLFGYGKEGKMIQPVDSIAQDLEDSIDQASHDGRISCKDCWRIAKELKASRIAVSSACEFKGLRIKPCQLGAF